MFHAERFFIRFERGTALALETFRFKQENIAHVVMGDRTFRIY